MRPSRGMGIIAPSKSPRVIKKRDGNYPVDVYKKGGTVNAEGKQCAAQPKDVAKKTAAFRR